VLSNISVVVCTYQVLTDALESGYVHLADISLLIFDEAHHCQKGGPANRIMQGFYHPAKQKGTETPSVLGLTASPINSKIDGLECVRSMPALGFLLISTG
jgi:ERCC4-related helicase